MDRNYESFAVGDYCILSKKFTKRDFEKFTDLSGDHNPLHHSKQYSNQSGYSDCVVPLFLYSSVLSQVAGMYMPGHRSLITSIKLDTKHPLYYEQELVCSSQIISTNDSTNTIVIRSIGRVGTTVIFCAEMFVKVRKKPETVQAKWVTSETLRKLQSGKILIAGSTSSIGQALAKLFAIDGYDLVLGYYANTQKARTQKAELSNYGIDISSIKLNRLVKNSCLVLRTEKKFSDIDTYVHLASSPMDSGIGDLIRSNYGMTREITEALLPQFMDHQYGKIVFVGSGDCVLSQSGYHDYIAAKSSAMAYMRSVSRNYRCAGVIAQTVAPDLVDTPYSEHLELDISKALTVEMVADQIYNLVVDRTGNSEEIKWLRAGGTESVEMFSVSLEKPINSELSLSRASVMPEAYRSIENNYIINDQAQQPSGQQDASERIEARKLIADILGVEIGTINSTSGMGITPEWTSIKQIEIVLELERKFGLSLKSLEIAESTTVDKLEEALFGKH